MKRLLTLLALLGGMLGSLSTPALAASDPRQALLAGMQKTQAVGVFRMEMIVNASTSGKAPGANLSLELVRMTGEVSNKNSHLVMGGTAGSMIGASQGLEIITVGTRVYVKGPIPSIGATEARWYYSADGTNPFGGQKIQDSDPKAALAALAKGDLSWVKDLGPEQIDGQKCTSYGTDDPSQLVRGIKALSAGQQQTQSLDLKGVKGGTLRMSICEDGYFHQMRVAIEGSDPSAPGMSYKVNVSMRFFDFGANIVIKAPANAVPLPAKGAAPASPAAPVGPGVSAEVVSGGNIRAEPSLKGAVLGQVSAGDKVSVLEKSADGKWFKVKAPQATGWVSVTLLRVVVEQSPGSGLSLTAKVFNGGNVRETPSLRGKVLDQINAGETVTLVGKTASGAWLKVTNERGVTGWVSRSLLTLDGATLAKVPVAP